MSGDTLFPAPAFGHADSVITIDIGAIVANWRYLDRLSGPRTETAAVVKADAYGLGAARVAPALAEAGCQTFFVASLAEAIALRAALSDAGHDGLRIFALGGCHAGQETDFLQSRIMPVINSLEQLERWRAAANNPAANIEVTPPGAALHLDTGMTRLGFDPDETAWLLRRIEEGDTPHGGPLAGIDIQLLMSHLSAGEDLTDKANDRQLASFERLRAALPGLPASLANSGGTLRGGGFHMALNRPGIALYGLHPAGLDTAGNQAEQAASLHPAVTWQARILQRREARAGERVGYNGTHHLTRDSRIVTLGVGYADGYPRNLGNRAMVSIAGMAAPVVGRVSMDSITVDVTDLDEALLANATHAEILGTGYALARMAGDAGTIGYEILTQLGRRPTRRYINS
jgi:alanine racemase